MMRLLWSTNKPVDFDGKFFQLENAVLGLEPYEGVPPQVWLAAHGPRMLRITGRLADGWLPTNIKPDAYAEKLGAIRESAEQAGPRPRRDHAVDARLRDLRARRGDARAALRRADVAHAVRRRRPARRDLRALRLDVAVRGRHRLSLLHADDGHARGGRAGRLAHPGRDRARAHAVRDAGDDRRRRSARYAAGRACATSCCGTSRRSPIRRCRSTPSARMREVRALLSKRPVA